MKNKKRPNKINIRPILILCIVALVTAGAVFGLMTMLNRPDRSLAQNDSRINYDPPTTEEIESGQSIKDANEKQNEQGPIVDHSIFVVDSSQYGQNIEVRSYIENIVEDGGACTFAFTKGTTVVTKTSKGFSDVLHTTCTPLIMPVSEFPASGSWSLLISYSSQSVVASSSNQNVEVIK
jgi:hypothetical protein